MRERCIYSVCVSLIVSAALFLNAGQVLCQEGGGVLVVPVNEQETRTQGMPRGASGLSPKEEARIQKQYQFDIRDKQILLSPFGYSQGDSEESGSSSRYSGEDEKLYRYFGSAMNLHKNGKTEEAIEILEYIIALRPGDEYVKSTLKKVKRENTKKQSFWKGNTSKDASRIKKNTIKGLLNEGKGYYAQKHYDRALSVFDNILSVDPGNRTAKKYMAKLKDFYLKQTRARRLVEEEVSSAGDAASDLLDQWEARIQSLADDSIDGAEYSRKDDSSVSEVKKAADQNMMKEEKVLLGAADRLIDEAEFDYLISMKRAESVLDQADMGMTVEEIVRGVRETERRKTLYTLGPGDIIQISVRDHPELSGTGVIRVNGEFILPFVYDVVIISGLTVPEVEEKITEAMARYVQDPVITVTIEEYRSKVFFVIDELGCTPYPITRPNLTLRDALFVANWGEERALGRIVVTKPDKIKPLTRTVDAYDMIYKGDLSNNITIENGDVIYIPLTIAAKTTNVISGVLSPFAAVRQSRDEWFYLKGDRRGYGEMTRMTDTSKRPEWVAQPYSYR